MLHLSPPHRVHNATHPKLGSLVLELTWCTFCMQQSHGAACHTSQVRGRLLGQQGVVGTERDAWRAGILGCLSVHGWMLAETAGSWALAWTLPWFCRIKSPLSDINNVMKLCWWTKLSALIGDLFTSWLSSSSSWKRFHVYKSQSPWWQLTKQHSLCNFIFPHFQLKCNTVHTFYMKFFDLSCV